MPRVLLAWIGLTDLRAAKGEAAAGAGPIAEALTALRFDHVVLLNNFKGPGTDIPGFTAWLKKRTEATIVVRQEELSSPTNHGEIYRVAMAAVAWTLEKHGKTSKLTYHLSPGTPAMAAVWIIVAKTQFQADLIESTKDKGVTRVDIPFELAAEFVPAAIRKTDQDLERLGGEGLRPEEPKFGDIVGRSAAMRHVVERARQAVPYVAPILIQGESGTGKELLAAAIHKESLRRDKPLVIVNCGAIPKDLVESHFFGHTKGSFTGAMSDQAGFFEQANMGTLFLDEIGELPLEAQVKLLRVLQEKKVRRIGGKHEIYVDVRIIAATNRDLLREVRAGRFREDLFFRLAVLVLALPPVREREGDVGLLLDAILERLNAERATRPGADQKKLSAGARNLLLRYSWPGNVREMEATLLRASIFSKGHVIDVDDLREAIVSQPTRGEDSVLGRSLGNGLSLKALLDEVAKHYLSRALEESHGNKTKAAALIGFSNYQTLTNWLKKYDLET